VSIPAVVRRSGPLAVALLGVNGWAVYGQAGWAVKALALGTLAACLFAATVESVAVYLACEAHAAQLAGDSSIKIRAMSYLTGAAVGAMNYSHYAVNGWRYPNPAALTFGALSALSPWLWAIRSRSLHRDQLRAAGLIDPRAARFSAGRWLHFPVRTLRALRWSIETGVTDPAAAWAGSAAARRPSGPGTTVGAVDGQAGGGTASASLTVTPSAVETVAPPTVTADRHSEWTAQRPSPAPGAGSQAGGDGQPPPVRPVRLTAVTPNGQTVSPLAGHRRRRTAGDRRLATATRDRHDQSGSARQRVLAAIERDRRGDLLPSATALMESTGVSESTVTRALRDVRTSEAQRREPGDAL